MARCLPLAFTDICGADGARSGAGVLVGEWSSGGVFSKSKGLRVTPVGVPTVEVHFLGLRFEDSIFDKSSRGMGVDWGVCNFDEEGVCSSSGAGEEERREGFMGLDWVLENRARAFTGEDGASGEEDVGGEEGGRGDEGGAYAGLSWVYDRCSEHGVGGGGREEDV